MAASCFWSKSWLAALHSQGGGWDPAKAGSVKFSSLQVQFSFNKVHVPGISEAVVIVIALTSHHFPRCDNLPYLRLVSDIFAARGCSSQAVSGQDFLWVPERGKWCRGVIRLFSCGCCRLELFRYCGLELMYLLAFNWMRLLVWSSCTCMHLTECAYRSAVVFCCCCFML